MDPISLSLSKSRIDENEVTEPVPDVREHCLEKCDDNDEFPLEMIEGFFAILSLNERRGFLTASIAVCLTHTRVPLCGGADMVAFFSNGLFAYPRYDDGVSTHRVSPLSARKAE